MDVITTDLNVAAKEAAASHLIAQHHPAEAATDVGADDRGPKRTPSDDRARANFWRAVALAYAIIGAAFLFCWALS